MLHDEAIDWLFSLHRFGMKLGLENIRALTEALGRPQDRFDSVLVAGTNGKGSTAAMLHQILVAAGVRSGLYTSPHLVRTEERIRIGDREIGSDALASALSDVREAIERILADGTLSAHPTFFEAITAAAFLSFERARTEVAVLEVGLGGRFDATNVVSPVLSIITCIDLDHEEQLGTTLASIALEKAGILRPGVVALVGETRETPLAVIREEAGAIGARVFLAREGCTVEVVGQDARAGGAERDARSVVGPDAQAHDGGLVIALTTPADHYPRLASPLAGEHQITNILLAVRAAEILRGDRRNALPNTDSGDAPNTIHARARTQSRRTNGVSLASRRDTGPLEPARDTSGALSPPIGADAVATGIARTRWPGRLEWIEGRPALLLDGAHNPAATLALVRHLDARAIRPVLLFASMRDKDYASMLALLLPRVSGAVFTRPPMDRAADPSDLMAVARRVDAGSVPGPLPPTVGGPPDREGGGSDSGASDLDRTRGDGPGGHPGRGVAALVREADADVAHSLERARGLAGPDGVVLVAGSLFLVGAVKAILEGASIPSGGGGA